MSSPLTSLPLLKYSSTAQQSEPFHWIHISSPDLFVAFDSLQSAHDHHGDFGPARLLKVVRGAELLEAVDIVRNVQQADAVLADARNGNRHLRIHELPISAMIRSGTPIVAVKYTLPDGMARRFQLRFSSEDDFRIAYNVINRAGVQISESPPLPKPVSRASSSHSVPNFTSSLPPSSPPKADVWHARQEIRRPTSSAFSGSQLPTIVERPPLRPSTAPTADLGSPGQMPPRRELPFPRPPSSSTQSLPGSRTVSKTKTAPNQTPIDDTDKHRHTGPLASSADLPPLVPPRLAQHSDGRTVSSATTTFGVGGADLELPFQAEQNLQGMSDRYPLQQHRPRSSSTAVAWQGRPTNGNAVSSDQVESDPSALLDSGSFVPPSVDERMGPSMHGISSGDGPRAGNPRSITSAWDANLTAYSSQSIQDREHQLDDIFAHCIHDDNFLLLCQDVASHWQRLYLGST